MENKIAIIGGSGLYNIEGAKLKKEHNVKTPFGQSSDKILEFEIDGFSFLFLPRHGRNHHLIPSEINARANIFALKKLGTRYLISFSAVGSLKKEILPRHFILPNQFIDWTKGHRSRSFFGEGLVGHISTAKPVDKNLTQLVSINCEKLLIPHHFGGTYICIEGPQFSTMAESKIYRSMGADIIGMTNLPEAYLAKEAGILYTTLGMVTDFDSWEGEGTSVELMLENLRHNSQMAQKLIPNIIKELSQNPISYKKENPILTPPSFWSKKHKEIAKVLLK